MTGKSPKEAQASVEKTIQRLVASKSNDEAKEVYAQWQTYDEDLDAYGYVAPEIAAGILSTLVPDKQALIFDAGCGSGKVGAELASLGFTQIVGSDLSESMLERAARLDVYSALSTADFSKPLTGPDNRYDALVSVGVWNDALAEPLTSEMLRVTKPGGALVISVRPQFMNALEPLLAKFTKNGQINSLEQTQADYITGQHSQAVYNSFRKV